MQPYSIIGLVHSQNSSAQSALTKTHFYSYKKFTPSSQQVHYDYCPIQFRGPKRTLLLTKSH